MKDYHINVFHSEEDDCYVADIPAVREVQVAKAAWLQVAKERGKPIPKPKYRPVIYQVAR